MPNKKKQSGAGSAGIILPTVSGTSKKKKGGHGKVTYSPQNLFPYKEHPGNSVLIFADALTYMKLWHEANSFSGEIAGLGMITNQVMVQTGFDPEDNLYDYQVHYGVWDWHEISMAGNAGYVGGRGSGEHYVETVMNCYDIYGRANNMQYHTHIGAPFWSGDDLGTSSGEDVQGHRQAVKSAFEDPDVEELYFTVYGSDGDFLIRKYFRYEQEVVWAEGTLGVYTEELTSPFEFDPNKVKTMESTRHWRRPVQAGKGAQSQNGVPFWQSQNGQSGSQVPYLAARGSTPVTDTARAEFIRRRGSLVGRMLGRISGTMFTLASMVSRLQRRIDPL